jgi:hypothetical protein
MVRREELDDDDDDDDLDDDDPLDLIREDLDQIKNGIAGIALLLLIIGGLALARLYHFL